MWMSFLVQLLWGDLAVIGPMQLGNRGVCTVAQCTPTTSTPFYQNIVEEPVLTNWEGGNASIGVRPEHYRMSPSVWYHIDTSTLGNRVSISIWPILVAEILVVIRPLP